MIAKIYCKIENARKKAEKTEYEVFYLINGKYFVGTRIGVQRVNNRIKSKEVF